MEDAIRMRWEQLRDRLDAEANAAKSSQEAVLQLSHAYTLLQPHERTTVDEVLEEWLENDDETKRFDALALIWDHRIETAVPALERLMDRLKRSISPGAPYELKKVDRLMRRLCGASPARGDRVDLTSSDE